MCGCFNQDLDFFVANAMAAQRRKTFALKFKNFPGLRAGGDLKGGHSNQCRHLDLSAQRRLSKTDRRLTNHIVALADKEFVRLDVNIDEKITARAAPHTA